MMYLYVGLLVVIVIYLTEKNFERYFRETNAKIDKLEQIIKVKTITEE